MPSTLFAFGIFLIGSYIYASASLDHNPPIHAFSIERMMGTHHHAQLLFVEMGAHFVSRLASNHNPLPPK
jgi:hypothetical protein